MKKRMLISLLICLIIVSILDIVSAGEGGGAVSVTAIDLSEQGNIYSIKPGRLKFEFDNKLYAIQVRRVKQEYVNFLVMTLDMNKLEDITAYTLDSSFNLSIGEKKEIDINKDGANDISIELNKIISTGRYKSIRFADFSIKKINTKKLETSLNNENGNMELVNSYEIINNEIQNLTLEPVIILNQKTQGQPTFLKRIANWFKELFK